MNDKIISFEERKRILDLKKQLDNHEITNDEISLEDLEVLNKLYYDEVIGLVNKSKSLQSQIKSLKLALGKNPNE